MTREHTKWSRLAETIGAAMFLAWTVILGPVGFLLLLGVAYAMVTLNCFSRSRGR